MHNNDKCPYLPMLHTGPLWYQAQKLPSSPEKQDRGGHRWLFGQRLDIVMIISDRRRVLNWKWHQNSILKTKSFVSGFYFYNSFVLEKGYTSWTQLVSRRLYSPFKMPHWLAVGSGQVLRPVREGRRCSRPPWVSQLRVKWLVLTQHHLVGVFTVHRLGPIVILAMQGDWNAKVGCRDAYENLQGIWGPFCNDNTS